MNLLRYIQMVLWSFFGIRRRAGANEELACVRPAPLVLTALVLAAGFAALLVWAARQAVDRLS